MFDYLTLHDGPVIAGLEQYETVFAKNQPQYIPMRTLPGENGNSAIARFHPTDEQRKAIAEGADIYLEILHYRGPLAPSRLMVMSEPQEQATHFLSWWRSQTKGDYPLPIATGVKAELNDATADKSANRWFHECMMMGSNSESAEQRAAELQARLDRVEAATKHLKELSEKAHPGPWHAVKPTQHASNDTPYILGPSKSLGVHGDAILTGLWPTHEGTVDATQKAEDITFNTTAFIVELVNWFRALAGGQTESAAPHVRDVQPPLGESPGPAPAADPALPGLEQSNDYAAETGIWTLVSPSGKRWTAESPLRVVSTEAKERVPARVQLARIFEACKPTAEDLAQDEALRIEGLRLAVAIVDSFTGKFYEHDKRGKSCAAAIRAEIARRMK